MADNDRQLNTPRRTRVEDADYVLRTDEPNLPRVREDTSYRGLAVLTILAAFLALLLLTAALTSAVRAPADDGPEEVRFSAAENAAAPGLALEDISAPVAAYYRAKGGDAVPGVGVFSVASDGPWAPLRPGDVITALDGRAVGTAADVLRELSEADGPLTMTVYRDGGYVELRTGPGR